MMMTMKGVDRMVFAEKTIFLKDGRRAVLRSPLSSDTEQLVKYMKQSAGETEFLLRYPEECLETVEEEATFVERTASSDDRLMIVCFVDGKIAGNCMISFNNRIKTRHRAELAIGILREYWRLGIGSAMFEELIRVAKERGVLQLELDYIDGNDRAKGLYEKMGFRRVGVKPDAIRLKDGTMRDEISMVKKL